MSEKRTYRKAPLEAHHQIVMERIGIYLKMSREDYSITKNEVNQDGISRALIDRIERGDIVTIQSLMRYMDYLQVDYSVMGELL